MTSLNASETALSPRGSTATPALAPKSSATPGEGRFKEIRLVAITLAAASAGAVGSGVIVRTALGMTRFASLSACGLSSTDGKGAIAPDRRLPLNFSFAVLTRSRNGIVMASVGRDSQYLLQCGLAFERLVDTSHAQSLHSFGDRLILDHGRRSALHN
jgi:hypothetical protein